MIIVNKLMQVTMATPGQPSGVIGVSRADSSGDPRPKGARACSSGQRFSRPDPAVDIPQQDVERELPDKPRQ
jgi:hypothetical protein